MFGYIEKKCKWSKKSPLCLAKNGEEKEKKKKKKKKEEEEE